MGAKATADPNTRIIDLTEAPTGGLVTVDVLTDIYSDLKDDWHSTAALQRLRFPLEPIAGDTISALESVGRYVFLRNQDGWRLRPYDADAEISLRGNIFARDATVKLWLPRPGRTIFGALERSSLALAFGSATDNVIALGNYELVDQRQYNGDDILTNARRRLFLTATDLDSATVSGDTDPLVDVEGAIAVFSFTSDPDSGRTPGWFVWERVA